VPVLLVKPLWVFQARCSRSVDIGAVVGVETAKIGLEVVAHLPVQSAEPLETIESQPFNCPLTFAWQGFISI
jgi:hypothetical protein